MTFFASAKRSDDKEIEEQLNLICHNPFIDGLMQTTNGFLAIINENRQIISANHSFLEMLNIPNNQDILGLRPGEAVKCVHSNDLETGCGTSKFCSTCGAAIAILTSLRDKTPTIKKCAIETIINGYKEDLFFEVRVHPISFENKTFLLLFLQDITKQQKWATIEKSFFHDLNNIISGLIGTSELLMLDPDLRNNIHIKKIKDLSNRLNQEILTQKYLTDIENQTYRPLWAETNVNDLFCDLSTALKNHPASANKELFFEKLSENFKFETDITLLKKALENLLINALEASAENSSVKIFFNHKSNEYSFFIWNNSSIPANITKRIFQRNFTTKDELGHGTNLYAIKLLCEKFLNGKIDFKTSEEDGTTFFITLPKNDKKIKQTIKHHN